MTEGIIRILTTWSRMQNHCISSIFNSNQCDTHVLFVFFSDYSYKEGDCFEVLKGEQLKSCPLILLLNRSHYADEIIDLFISSSTIFLSSSLSLSLSVSCLLILAAFQSIRFRWNTKDALWLSLDFCFTHLLLLRYSPDTHPHRYI